MAGIEQRMATAFGLDLGLPVIARSLVGHELWIVPCGLAVHLAGRNCFLDRMALLDDDLAGSSVRSGATGERA
jgi:hypothetical protein